MVERVEGRVGPANILLLSVVLGAVTTAVPAFTTNPFIVGGAFATAGVTVVMWNVVTVSLRQRIVPRRVARARQRKYRLFAGGAALGALLGGVIGSCWLARRVPRGGAVVALLAPGAGNYYRLGDRHAVAVAV